MSRNPKLGSILFAVSWWTASDAWKFRWVPSNAIAKQTSIVSYPYSLAIVLIVGSTAVGWDAAAIPENRVDE